MVRLHGMTLVVEIDGVGIERTADIAKTLNDVGPACPFQSFDRRRPDLALACEGR
jgi:hypothetical protein